MAGLHVSQLFRRRKELCKDGEAKYNAVCAGRDWAVCAAAGGGRPFIDDDGGASTEEPGASSRLILVAGTASGSMATLIRTCHPIAFSRLWNTDDPDPDGRASVAGDGPYRHAVWLSELGSAGAGGLEA